MILIYDTVETATRVFVGNRCLASVTIGTWCLVRFGRLGDALAGVWSPGGDRRKPRWAGVEIGQGSPPSTVE